jgi:hypothetical protein
MLLSLMLAMNLNVAECNIDDHLEKAGKHAAEAFVDGAGAVATVRQNPWVSAVLTWKATVETHDAIQEVVEAGMEWWQERDRDNNSQGTTMECWSRDP